MSPFYRLKCCPIHILPFEFVTHLLLVDKYRNQFTEYQENKQPQKIFERKICACTGILWKSARAFHVPVQKNGFSHILFVEKRGLIIYLVALKKGAIRHAHPYYAIYRKLHAPHPTRGLDMTKMKFKKGRRHQSFIIMSLNDQKDCKTNDNCQKFNWVAPCENVSSGICGERNITKTRLHNFDPLKSHFYIVKLEFTGVYIIFFLFLLQNRLWLLVRTASSHIHTMPYIGTYVLSRKVKNMSFLCENFQFLEVKFSIYLNRRVFVMAQINLRIHTICSWPSLSANIVIGYYKMYEWIATSRMRRVMWIGTFCTCQKTHFCLVCPSGKLR